MEYTIGFKPCQLESRYYKKAPTLTSECLLIVGEGSITLGKSLELLRQISTSLTGAPPFALSSSSNSLFVSSNPYLPQNNKTPTLIGGCLERGLDYSRQKPRVASSDINFVDRRTSVRLIFLVELTFREPKSLPPTK